ncbi:M1 family aminopeptidase [Paucibacter sp. AS339]|uniref:M1 family metallopeptidase n=1 Tax=Paucibacter hankyongi TaxID=3133434 RepID=UPI0030A08F2F
MKPRASKSLPQFHALLTALLSALLASPALAQWQAPAYHLQLRPDFKQQTVAARASVQLHRGPNSETGLRLNAPDLDILEASINGQSLSAQKQADAWLITLPPDLATRQDLTLMLDYIAKAGEGLVFGPDYVYTAFHTCRWLPCLGSDLGRAALSLSLELPAGYDSLASGQPTEASDKQHRQWRQAQPYPLYTLGFAAGRFTRATQSAGGSGRDSTTLHYLGVADEPEALLAKFKSTPAMLAFFSAKAGLPRSHPSYSQLLLPGGVAQEASSYALIGRRMLDPILETEQEDWVIAHELAHQWWGTLISCESWSEFWLNEGVTVFMTAAWKQQRWGEAAYQREMDIATRGWQRAKDAGFDKPLSWPGDYPSLGLKRAIHYSKAALFMQALRQDMGEQQFWAGFKHYTQSNAGRQVRAHDLQVAMEAKAGRSLQALFDAWVY